MKSWLQFVQAVAMVCASLVLMVLLALSASAQGEPGGDLTRDLPDTAPGLSYEQANAIRPKHPSVVAAVEARRTAAENLAAIKYRLTDAIGNPKGHTVMVLQPTKHGLQYFQHAATPHGFGGMHEAGLSLFGVATLVYWVSFLPDPPTPWQVSVEQGRLFSADSGFVVRQVDPAGDVTTTRCEPGRRLDASTLNESLRGKAVQFACADTMDGEDPIKRDVVYLERYGQYIPSVNYEKSGGVATKFELVAVTVQAGR